MGIKKLLKVLLGIKKTEEISVTKKRKTSRSKHSSLNDDLKGKKSKPQSKKKPIDSKKVTAKKSESEKKVLSRKKNDRPLKKNAVKKKKKTVEKKIVKKKPSKKGPVKKKTVRKKTVSKAGSKKNIKISHKSKTNKSNLTSPGLKKIGVVTHYFGKISVGIIELSASLSSGETITIKGANTYFSQKIVSMQVNHRAVDYASKGDQIGIKVKKRVHVNDKVYL